MGTDTLEDREYINTRLIGEKFQLPSVPEVCYACPTNKECNAITAGVFKNHVVATHPLDESNEKPPRHTLMVEAYMRRKRKHISQVLHDLIVLKVGDNDIKSTTCTSKGSKIDPVLRLFPGAPMMCISNKDLKKGRGNATICKFVSVKLKCDQGDIHWKNWDDKKVNTASIDDIEWMQFQHWPKPPDNVS